MMAASRASVLASPECKSAMRRIASLGGYPTRTPSERTTATGNAPMSSICPCCFRSDNSGPGLVSPLGNA